MPSAVLWIFRSVADRAEEENGIVQAAVSSPWQEHTQAFALVR